MTAASRRRYGDGRLVGDVVEVAVAVGGGYEQVLPLRLRPGSFRIAHRLHPPVLHHFAHAIPHSSMNFERPRTFPRGPGCRAATSDSVLSHPRTNITSLTDAPDFPAPLIDAQREILQIQTDLHALQTKLAWSREPNDAMKIDGWRPFERPATDGWSEQDAIRVDELRGRERELATFIVCHRHWSSFSGPDRVTQRSVLKHLPQAQPLHDVDAGADAPQVVEAA
ncbi:hypothetical protein [Streptomyces sp. NPDC057694]|uniref:hypothetical protein n=1 Tax=Streptomyces sp. NPDC057694 TaxID=3346216 RepID=UPI0036B746A9